MKIKTFIASIIIGSFLSISFSEAGTSPPGVSVGTSGPSVGLLNSNKTDSGNNTFTGTNNFTGPTELGGTALGTASTATLGTSGSTVGLLNANKTDTGSNVFSNTKTLNSIQFTSQYASGSNTGGIAEAYAACGSANCKIFVDQNITITSAQTLSVTNTSILEVDLLGHSITCAPTANNITCLTVIKPDNIPRGKVMMRDGKVTCSGTATGRTALQWGSGAAGTTATAVTDSSMSDIEFTGCSNTSDTTLAWVNDEEVYGYNLAFSSNTLSFLVLNSNNNACFGCMFQQNVNGFKIQDSSEFSFIGGGSQSGSGTTPNIIDAANTTVAGIKFLNFHLENNGDSTANARQLEMEAATGLAVQGVSISNSTITLGTYGASGKVFGFTGPGVLNGLTLDSITGSGATGAWYDAGVLVGSGVTAINTSYPDNWDVALNSGNGIFGASFNPIGGREYSIFSGWPGEFSGDLVFYDWTANAPIAEYSPGAWNFLTNNVETTGFFFGAQFISTSTNQAQSGVLRLANTDESCTRNAANSADDCHGEIQHARVAGCTTSASAGGSCSSNITVTWPSAFADTNYTVSCTGNTPTNVPAAPFIVASTKLAASIHVNYFAITAAAAAYSTIECVAIHD